MSPGPVRRSPGALVVVAALPRELAQLARDLGAASVSQHDGVHLLSASVPRQPGKVLLVTAGMGPTRVALAVAAALAAGAVDTLLSVGLAGACDPNLQPGHVVRASLVIDSRSGERFKPDAPSGLAESGVLVTSPVIAGVAEKQRLRATYGAAIVDMEAATVARLANANRLPFAALKAISDEHTIDLTQLSRFSDHRGRFRTGSFVVHTALRPHLWSATAILGRNSKLALEALTSSLRQIIAERRD